MTSDTRKLQFKVGDKVRVTNWDSGTEKWYQEHGYANRTWTITKVNPTCFNIATDYLLDCPHGLGNGYYPGVGRNESDLELVTQGDKNMNETVTTQDIKDLKLSSEDRLLRESGLVNIDGTRTATYDAILMDKLEAMTKDEVVQTLQAIVKARKATK